MEIDAQFWIKAWTEGRTAFHKSDFHDRMVEFFPKLDPKPGQKVLVPLCGKTKDLIWLSQLQLQVHGVELHEPAAKAFFEENKLAPEVSNTADYAEYRSGGIRISCGDFFKLPRTETYDLIYDRASLVALPKSLRKNYAEVITSALKKGGKYLLITYQYDESQMTPPPFSVPQKEVEELYEDNFKIQLVQDSRPNQEGARLAILESLRQQVYLLEKNA